jgi:hypothetical protein
MLHVTWESGLGDGAFPRFAARAGLVAAALMIICKPDLAGAHGFAGARFFPATILTDDPFVADEMSLPTLTRLPDALDGTRFSSLESDISKRITPDFGLTWSDAYDFVQKPGLPAVTGLDTMTAGAQYQLFINGEHEAMGLAGLKVSWGHTGRVAALGQPGFTTLTPTFDWGKGFGDLPDSLNYLKPFAITGNLSVDFPTKIESAGVQHPNNFNYGFALEYPISYLESQVKDFGLRSPWQQMIPLVEFAAVTPFNRITPGVTTTGTIQPGVIWAGQYFQIGAEMILPMNRASGHGIGGLVQFHVYLDDAFSHSIGKPIAEWFQ